MIKQPKPLSGADCGNAGVLKHLQDIDALISNSNKYKGVIETMEMQYKWITMIISIALAGFRSMSL